MARYQLYDFAWEDPQNSISDIDRYLLFVIDKLYIKYKCQTLSERRLMNDEMNMALYGHMISGLLWYQKLKK